MSTRITVLMAQQPSKYEFGKSGTHDQTTQLRILTPIEYDTFKQFHYMRSNPNSNRCGRIQDSELPPYNWKNSWIKHNKMEIWNSLFIGLFPKTAGTLDWKVIYWKTTIEAGDNWEFKLQLTSSGTKSQYGWRLHQPRFCYHQWLYCSSIWKGGLQIDLWLCTWSFEQTGGACGRAARR